MTSNVRVRAASAAATTFPILSALLVAAGCVTVNNGGGGDDDDADIIIVDLGQAPPHDTDGSNNTEPTGETSSDSGPGRNTDGADEGDTFTVGEGDGTLYIVNLSGAEVYSAYMGDCAGGGWSDDLLGMWVMPHGWYLTVTGVDRGCYDVLAYDTELAAWDDGLYWAAAGIDIDPEYTLILAPPYSTGDDDDDVVGDDDDDVVGDDDVVDDCDDTEVLDCNDECAPAEWVGDGSCDDGLDGGADFDCADFDYDYGDCADVGDDDDDDTTVAGGTVEFVNYSSYDMESAVIYGYGGFAGDCGWLPSGDSCVMTVYDDDSYYGYGFDSDGCEYYSDEPYVSGGDWVTVYVYDSDAMCP